MKKKKHPVTLIEIMIVIVIIGLIGGALAYNMRGSLEKGKTFKTEQGITQIENILLLALAEGETVTADNWEETVRNSPLVKNPKKLLVDGWNKPYTVIIDNNQITVTSESL